MAEFEEVTLAIDLACFLIQQQGRQIDPATTVPIACGWSLRNLYTSCLDAVRVIGGLPKLSVDATAKLRVRQPRAAPKDWK